MSVPISAPEEKIKHVKDNISERAQISPEGPIYLRLYSVTYEEDGPTHLSVDEQGAILGNGDKAVISSFRMIIIYTKVSSKCAHFDAIFTLKNRLPD